MPLLRDFAGVEYVSSVGLRVLMLTAKQVKAQNGRIAIAALTPLVSEVFQISRFDLIFSVFDTLDSAFMLHGWRCGRQRRFGQSGT